MIMRLLTRQPESDSYMRDEEGSGDGGVGARYPSDDEENWDRNEGSGSGEQPPGNLKPCSFLYKKKSQPFYFQTAAQKCTRTSASVAEMKTSKRRSTRDRLHACHTVGSLFCCPRLA